MTDSNDGGDTNWLWLLGAFWLGRSMADRDTRTVRRRPGSPARHEAASPPPVRRLPASR